MSAKKLLLLLWVGAVCTSSGVLPTPVAQAAPGDIIEKDYYLLPPALPRLENSKELEDMGCVKGEAIPYEEAALGFKAFKAPDGFSHRRPSDAPVALFPGGVFYFCPPGAYTNHDEDPPQELTDWQGQVVWYLSAIIALFASVGLWILNIGSHFLGFILAENRFITHPFVTAGWPFVQGLANIGFILALLFIAFATTLQLESINAKRMLPRLLLAALLINFSLVIAGILIDASRLLMAIMTNLLSSGDDFGLADLGAGLLKNTNLLTNTLDVSYLGSIPGVTLDSGVLVSWRLPLEILRAAILIWALGLGVFTVGIAMFVRYIALLLLLVVSPLAYLAIAFPNADQLAQKWWTEFLKWVMYGPAALFILLLLSQLNQFDNAFGQTPTSALQSVIKIFITVAMLIAAATVGKTLGGVGANFAASAASGLGRGSRTVAKYGAQGLYVGSGGRRLSRNIRDAGREFVKPFGDERYDDKGQLKKGKKSFGASVGKAVAPNFLSKEGREKTQEVRAAKNVNIAVNPAAAVPAAGASYNAPWSPNNLAKEHVGAALSQEQRRAVFQHGNSQQKIQLVGNKEAVRNMDDAEKDAILRLPTNEIEDHPTNTNNKATDDANRTLNRNNKALNTLHKSLIQNLRKATEAIDKE